MDYWDKTDRQTERREREEREKRKRTKKRTNARAPVFCEWWEYTLDYTTDMTPAPFQSEACLPLATSLFEETVVYSLPSDPHDEKLREGNQSIPMAGTSFAVPVARFADSCGKIFKTSIRMTRRTLWPFTKVISPYSRRAIQLVFFWETHLLN